MPSTPAWVLLVVAVIAATASLIVAVINRQATRRNQKTAGDQAEELAKLQGKLKEQQDRQLALLQGELHEQQARRQARRDYVYKARIRLYEGYEPLLFQLAEASERALYRIISIARLARRDEISEDGSGSLAATSTSGRDDRYYLKSTAYSLLAPLAVFTLMRRSLTRVDLSVDSQVAQTYLYAKRLYIVLSDDFELAREPPELGYEPFEQPQERLRLEKPAVHCRQGVAIGRIDNAAESLIAESQVNKQRVMTLGNFMKAASDPDSEVSQNVKPIMDMLVGFHPATRPVLWRILITKAQIYNALLTSEVSRVQSQGKVVEPWEPITIEGDRAFDWRTTSSTAGDSEVREPFLVAEAYLRRHLKPLLPVPIESENSH